MSSKNILHIVLSLAAMTLVVGCDNIPQDERLIYVKPAAVQRAVLIEDFTGQRCINCPDATEVIHQLQEQYGDSSVIAVGLHSGPSLRNVPYALYTAEGDEYFNHWHVESQPSGMVNRLSISKHPDWPAQVYAEIQRTASVSLRIVAQADAQARQLSVDADMMALDGLVEGKLQLWLLEDSITDFQYMPDGSVNREYVHNHVFRTSINGTWGQDISVPEGEMATRQATITISEDYDLGHLSVVAFIYNATGVLQATRARVSLHNQP